MNEIKPSGVVQPLRGEITANGSQQAAQSLNSSSSARGAEQGPVKAEKNVQADAQILDRQEPTEQGTEAELKVAVAQLNDYIQNVQRDLKFQTDDASGKTVVTVVDRQTEEVVRQIPDDVALSLAQKLQQDEPLSLFNIKA